ncbi:MAG TPA: dockerin type I domain-containing protein, partial [Clostridia bacterium]|nr:dockerin type I domain-containing protein [Clostridia bacterium]
PEVDFTIKSKSGHWDSSNDWSFKNWDSTYINGTRKYAPNMPIYEGDNFKKLAGNEPAGGSEKKASSLTPVYPQGQTKFDVSKPDTEVKVKLTDASGNGIAGKTIVWTGKGGAYYTVQVQPSSSVTDSNGIATAKVPIIVMPDSSDNKVITVDSYITASFKGDTEYLDSQCNANIYGEFSMGFLVGDVNMDQRVDAIDYAVLKQYLLKISGISIDAMAADMNDDGHVDALDFALLKIKLLNRQ